MASHSNPFTGRGATVSPPNRFESAWYEADYEQLEPDDELLAAGRKVATQFLPDASLSIITSNDSPDVPFTFSMNPYRGCEHGCAYCYARPTHEYLGMNAGIDFETRIMVKHDAPRLLALELNKRSWKCELIAISGVTDCYQPAERKFRLTRGLLEVLLEAHQPAGLITKNALVVRDLDLLAQLAAKNLVSVALSVTTLDADLARTLEPRTSTPQAKLRAIRELSSAGIPTRVMVAPIIPGLNDHEIPGVLEAVRDAGAQGAGYVMLRLPWGVKPIFRDWLRTHRPLQADRVEGLLREVRDGQLTDPNFGSRMRGTGPYAETIRATFAAFVNKLGLDTPWPELDTTQFRPPELVGGQKRLF
ncbi:MAG: PA0069 family radical SAM protein [Pirellulaceae bacterium]